MILADNNKVPPLMLGILFFANEFGLTGKFDVSFLVVCEFSNSTNLLSIFNYYLLSKFYYVSSRDDDNKLISHDVRDCYILIVRQFVYFLMFKQIQYF